MGEGNGYDWIKEQANGSPKTPVAPTQPDGPATPQPVSWVEDNRKSVLLYGPPKSGKTWAYCGIIKEAIDAGHHIFLINTDSGVAKTFKQYFGDKYKDYAVKVTFFMLTDIKKAASVVLEIRKTAKKGDWVIVDLISDSYEMAQLAFLHDISHGNPEKYIIDAEKDIKKFGLFEGSKWNYIKALDAVICNDLVKYGEYNILGVATAKDTDPGEKITGKKDKNFSDVGQKPGGAKDLSYKFDDVVLICSGGGRYMLKVVGKRGFVPDDKWHEYGRDFITKYNEVTR